MKDCPLKTTIALPKTFGIVGLISTLALFSLQCIDMPQTPVMPNWNTQLSIPLVDTVYSLNDAFKDNDEISSLNGVFQYRPAPRIFDPIVIGDSNTLRLNPPVTDTSFSQQVGELEIPVPAPFFERLTAASIITDFATFRDPNTNRDTTLPIMIDPTQPITIFPIPQIGFTELPASFLDTTIVFPSTGDFNYLQLTSGGFQLVVTNNLPIDLPTVPVEIRNSDNELLATVSLSNLLSGAADSQFIDLANKKITGGMSVKIALDVPSRQLPITFLPEHGVGIKATLVGPLVVRRAEVRIPAFVIADEHISTVPIDDSTFVNEVRFSRGKVRVTISSAIDADVSFFFTFKELVRSKLNEPFSIDEVVSPTQPLTFTVPLGLGENDYRFLSQQNQNTINLALKVKTLEPDRITTIYDTNSVSVRVEFLDTPFILDAVRGRLTPFHRSVNETVEIPEIRVGSGFSADSVVLPNSSLRLFIASNAGHPFDLALNILGFDKEGRQRGQIGLPSNDESPTPGVWRFRPGRENVIELNGNLFSQFMKQFPESQLRRLSIVGSIDVNPIDVYSNPDDPNHIGQIVIGDSVFTRAEYGVPLSLGVYNGAFTDTIDIGGSDSKGSTIDEDILTSIVEGRLSFQVENTIPVHLGLRTSFLDAFGRVILTPDSLDITTGTSQPTLRLTRDQALKFNQAKKVIVRLLMDTESQTAILNTSQYVKVRLSANLVYNVNPTK